MNTDGRQLAVVTGASSGIGFELAKVFAEDAFDLIVAAEDEELDHAHGELGQVGNVLDSVRVDLSRPEGVERLYERITADGRPVDVLCLNAGIGAGGEFARETSLDKELRLIDLNVRSTVHLCKLVPPRSRARATRH
jgi:short-subunit dehydrogenase